MIEAYLGRTSNGADQPRLAVQPGPRMIEVDGLDAGYNGNPVVRDLTLHVGAAEVVALLGANGAGKTTTLSTIAGLQRPLAGRIRMDSEDIAGIPAHRLARRGVSLVPEGRALFFGLTTREHLRLARARAPATTRCSTCFPSCASAWTARPGCCRAASSRCSRSAGPSRVGRGCCSSTR